MFRAVGSRRCAAGGGGSAGGHGCSVASGTPAAAARRSSSAPHPSSGSLIAARSRAQADTDRHLGPRQSERDQDRPSRSSALQGGRPKGLPRALGRSPACRAGHHTAWRPQPSAGPARPGRCRRSPSAAPRSTSPWPPTSRSAGRISSSSSGVVGQGEVETKGCSCCVSPGAAARAALGSMRLRSPGRISPLRSNGARRSRRDRPLRLAPQERLQPAFQLLLPMICQRARHCPSPPQPSLR